MQKILVVEEHEAEMRLMVWLLTDDGGDVRVTSSVGEVIAEAERFEPDTIVFNSRGLGEAKAKAIDLIRALRPSVRIIDVSTPPLAGERRFVDVTKFNERDPRRSDDDDVALSGGNLIDMVHRRRKRAG